MTDTPDSSATPQDSAGGSAHDMPDPAAAGWPADDDAATLTERQKTFCAAVADGMSASAAARVAGYAVRSAGNQGHRMMKNDEIRRKISKLRAAGHAARADWAEDLLVELRSLYAEARSHRLYHVAIRCLALEGRVLDELLTALPKDVPPSDETSRF